MAHRPNPTSTDFVSNRVYSGTRRLSPARVALLRANYQRTHTTVVRAVAVSQSRALVLKTS